MLDLTQSVRGRVLQARGDGIADVVDGEGRVARVQEVGGIVRRNLFEQNESARRCGFRPAPVFRRVARIPLAVVDIARAQGLDLLRDPEAMRLFLNHSDNRAFRTTLEKV